MGALLTISLVSRAQDEASPSQNPYTALANRNVFGLVPIPPPPPPEAAPIDPPPKITVNGLMRLFANNYQVLFKTPGKAKPGLPPKEESYVLGEGERQDDIEVKKINPDTGMVTFVNHGVVQECALVVAQNTGPVAMPSAPGMVAGGAVPTLGVGGPGGGRFGRVPRPAGKNVTSSADIAPQAGLGNPNAGFNGNSDPNSAEHLSPEAQAIQIEYERIRTQKQVDEGTMPPLPPIPGFTPEDATAHGGSPLIVPNSPPTPPNNQ
jgi:hypothetical protein